MNTAYNEIKRKLERLRKTDRGFQAFGSKMHQYILHPPLASDSVAQFENKHNVKLPAEYRDFLIQAGNGGAGPYYGLYSLRQAYEENEWFVLDSIDKPFPVDLFASKDTAIPIDADLYDGSIMLAHLGCGMFANLVVSGPESGKVWYDLMSSQDEVKLSGQSFLEWYLHWLK